LDADAGDEDAETGAAAAAWPVAPAVEFAEAEAEEDEKACEDGNATATLGSALGAACATASDTAPAAALSSAPLRYTSRAGTSEVTGRTFQPCASAVG
jgi:hypothetical protein